MLVYRLFSMIYGNFLGLKGALFAEKWALGGAFSLLVRWSDWRDREGDFLVSAMIMR